MSAIFVLGPRELVNVLTTKSTNQFSIENDNSIIIQTKMTDQFILNNAVNEYLNTLSEYEREIYSERFLNDEMKMEFRVNENQGNFEAVFNNFSKDEALGIVDKIFDIYTSLVQERVYKSVIEKLKERDMFLDNEEILEDNSVVLTVSLTR